jgi:hypothetical protein
VKVLPQKTMAVERLGKTVHGNFFFFFESAEYFIPDNQHIILIFIKVLRVAAMMNPVV